MSMRLMIVVILAASLEGSEPSAFGAGNLESKEPYGLSQTEKLIFRNKQSITSIEAKHRTNSRSITTLRERIDGLQTVIEGLSEKTQSAQVEMDKKRSEASEHSDRLTSLEASVAANAKNIGLINQTLGKLIVNVDAINRNYVDKAEYNKLVEDLNTLKSDLAGALKMKTTATSDPFEGLSNKELRKRADKNYKRLYFKYAIPQYEEMIRRKYMDDYAHFMIAEMWHYRSECETALSFYKASSVLKSEASYTPKLLLHSAECMAKTNDADNAKAFLHALKAKYPNSVEASQANKVLNTLQ